MFQVHCRLFNDTLTFNCYEICCRISVESEVQMIFVFKKLQNVLLEDSCVAKLDYISQVLCMTNS
jgi:hypothetical protein